MMKKFTHTTTCTWSNILVASLLATVLLTGCGGDKKPAPAAGGAQPAAPAAAEVKVEPALARAEAEAAYAAGILEEDYHSNIELDMAGGRHPLYDGIDYPLLRSG